MIITLDCEFTGLHKDTSLISLSLVDSRDQKFHAEFIDYDNDGLDVFIINNIIDKLLYKDYEDFVLDRRNNYLGLKGTTSQITEHLNNWMGDYDYIEIWSDVLAYDWVLFCDLFGGALNIPKNLYYIPMDLATAFKLKGVDPDINREKFAGIESIEGKHNSLHDAMVIMKCLRKLGIVS